MEPSHLRVSTSRSVVGALSGENRDPLPQDTVADQQMDLIHQIMCQQIVPEGPAAGDQDIFAILAFEFGKLLIGIAPPVRGSYGIGVVRNWVIRGPKSVAAVSGSTWPPGKTCRVAFGMSAARIRALLTGTIGSSSPPITSTGCRMSFRNGRLVQLAAAASWYR